MKKVLVTGHRGYIGSVLCKLLREKGYYVIGTDTNKLESLSPYANENYHLCFSGVYDTVGTFTNLNEVDGIFHLAANSLLGPSAYDPMSYFINNVGNTSKLLKAMGKRKMVYASSAAVYQEVDEYVPIKEDAAKGSPNYYGKSKWMSEEVIQAFCEVVETPVTCFRFFNVAGSYGDVGIQDNTPHLLSQLRYSQDNNKKFKVYGGNYDTQDGTCVRDYVHVVDVCNAMIHAYETIDQPGYRAYNLGLGKGTSVYEMILRFIGITGKLDYEFVEERKGDPAYLVADPNKFIQDTGFVYQKHLIEDMIFDSLMAARKK
jgi:UDP-glucose 4-epimerase